MLDEEKAIQNAFENLLRVENVRILSENEKRTLDFLINTVVWEVETEILFLNQCFRLTLHITFENHFPFEIPKIYLAPSSYEKIKYIPHIDTKRLVCTFDSEIASTNPNEPFGIIMACLKRAKEIILDGLSGSNHLDFEEEFIAYWEGKYDKSDELPKEVLSIIDNILIPENLKLICLRSRLSIYKYVLHIDDELAQVFKQFLSDYDFKFEEVDVFYFNHHNFKDVPPFNLKNKESLKYLNTESEIKRFTKFINKNSYPKLVVTSKIINDNEFIFGWFHNFLNTSVKGFRPGIFNPFDALTKTQANDSVQRISTEKFTYKRLDNRTSGIPSDYHKLTFTIVGIGSIGSNLYPYLNSFNYPAFKFIDKELLKLENIGRHFLGFNNIGNYKSKALGDYAKLSNPLQIISTKEDSILKVIKHTPEYLNESDYLFVAIGNKNIENWIGNALFEGIIKVPTFFLWVEPYLSGGHCIYINPLQPTYKNYFEEGYFKYNVISNTEYANSNSDLSLKEGGCQTTYIPYSASNITGFLSCLFPKIAFIIEGLQENSSKSFTWVGNTDKIISLGIKMSEIGENFSRGDLIENIL